MCLGDALLLGLGVEVGFWYHFLRSVGYIQIKRGYKASQGQVWCSGFGTQP